MPEKDYHKNNNREDMRRFEEFVAEVSKHCISHAPLQGLHFLHFDHYLPNQTVRSKGKPRLEHKRNDTSPVKYQAHRDLHLHIMEPDVIDDEWEGVHKRKKEEGIGGPSVEHLEPLMRNSSEERDPIRLGCSCAVKC
jgi:hypothetical protein